MQHCVIHIDGGARGNPGPAGAGVVIADDDGTPMHEAGYFLGRATNNVAEYQGLVRALEQAAAMGVRRLTLRSDSQLLVRQLTGEYRVKSAELRPLFERVQSLLRRFEGWSIEHVPREGNTRADALANRAMDAQADVIESAGSAFAAGGGGEDAPAATQRWTLTLVSSAGPCPAGQPRGRAFTFGPTTPAGCCVHAAAAAFRDGPLHWPTGRREGHTQCGHCGARVALKRV